MGTNMVEDPVRFSGDKPKECKFCYFWHPRKKCCSLGEKNCFYIVPEEEPPEPTRCDDCPYGRVAPCIGWCTVDVLEAVLGKRMSGKNQKRRRGKACTGKTCAGKTCAGKPHTIK